MKRMLFVLSLVVFTSALCHAQFTFPYVLAPPTITCSPASCNSYLQLGPGSYGGVSVFAQGSCASGIRPYVQPQQVDFFCQYPQTLIYAYAYASQTPNIYVFSFGTIYAQQVQGNNGTYGLIGGNWVNIFSGVQFNDCYTGALRNFQPPPHPC